MLIILNLLTMLTNFYHASDQHKCHILFWIYIRLYFDSCKVRLLYTCNCVPYSICVQKIQKRLLRWSGFVCQPTWDWLKEKFTKATSWCGFAVTVSYLSFLLACVFVDRTDMLYTCTINIYILDYFITIPWKFGTYFFAEMLLNCHTLDMIIIKCWF